MGIGTTESGLAVVNYPKSKATAPVTAGQINTGVPVVDSSVSSPDSTRADSEPAVKNEAPQVAGVDSSEAKPETKKVVKFWTEGRTQKEQTYDEMFGTVAEVAGTFENPSEELAQALAVNKYLDKPESAASAQYDPRTADFVGSDGNPDNFNRHAYQIIHAVEDALAAGGISNPEAEAILAKLKPRLSQIVDSKNRPGYGLDTREVRGNQTELARDSFDMMTEMLGLVDANELYKTNPDLYGKIFGVWTMLYNGRRSPANALPANVQLQLVHEVVGLVNSPRSGANLDFSWQRIDKDGNASTVRARNIASEVTIAYRENSENGQRNLAAEWFVDQAAEMGISVDGKTVKGNEAEFVAMLSAGETRGIDMFTSFEGLLHEQVIAGDNKIGSFFKDKLGIDLTARFKKYENPLFKAMAQSNELAGRVGRKVFGDRGFTAEWLEQVKQLTGIDMAKRLDRLQKRGVNYAGIGMGALLLYSTIGPLMSMEDETQQPQ